MYGSDELPSRIGAEGANKFPRFREEGASFPVSTQMKTSHSSASMCVCVGGGGGHSMTEEF